MDRWILYDNTKIAVARILGDRKRQRARVFTELKSHYLFEDRYRIRNWRQRAYSFRRGAWIVPFHLFRQAKQVLAVGGLFE